MPKPKSRGNGQGTAYRRGRSWQARVVVGWKLIGDPPHKCPIYRTKDGFRTRREALEYCPSLKAQAVGQRAAAPALSEYWATYSAKDMAQLSESKQCAYKIAWDKLSSLQLRRVDTLTVSDLRRVVEEKAPTYYPARDMKVLLGHLFDLAGADGWVNRDLPDYIILPSIEEKERLPFSDIEQAALWKAYESGCRDAAIPLIMIYTGMMPGELRRLTVDMIDYEARQIVGVGMKTKVRKAAAVYLPGDIIPLLQDAAAGKTGLVFDCSETAFYARYYAALDAANVRRLTPYSCRHTTATALAINENIAPQTVRKIMRWSTTRMLDRYAHPTDTDANEAIDTLKRKQSP